MQLDFKLEFWSYYSCTVVVFKKKITGGFSALYVLLVLHIIVHSYSFLTFETNHYKDSSVIIKTESKGF